MHRRSKNVFVRLAGIAVAAVLATTGVTALTSSSGAITVGPTQKVVKISNAYQLAQCSLVINGHDFNGNSTGYITAQSQNGSLGGFVKSTKIDCFAYNADSALVGSFEYVGTGAYLNNTRKNGSYGLSPTYTICIVLTRYDYIGGSVVSSKCA